MRKELKENLAKKYENTLKEYYLNLKNEKDRRISDTKTELFLDKLRRLMEMESPTAEKIRLRA